jgi:hypothetical protein
LHVASSQDQSNSPEQNSKLHAGGYSRESYENLPAEAEEKEAQNAAEKPAPEVDLLDVTSWDAPTQSQSAAPEISVVASPINANYSQPQGQNFAPQYHPTVHQNQFPVQQVPGQQHPLQPQSNAMVVTSQSYGYPGAPPVPIQQLQLQQSYPGVAPLQPASHPYHNNQSMTQPMAPQTWNGTMQPQQSNPWISQQQQQQQQQYSYQQPPQFQS